MRALTAKECHTPSGGEYSTFDILGLTFASSAVTMGTIRGIKTLSLQEGLYAGWACGVLTTLTALGFLIIGHTTK